MSVNIILCEDVDNLGEMGEKVRVAPGYARNYLVPRKLAVLVHRLWVTGEIYVPIGYGQVDTRAPAAA